MKQKKVTAKMVRGFERYLADEEKSSATIGKYLRDLKAFLKFADSGAITKELVVRYKEHLKQAYKPASVNSMLAAVNLFLKWLGWYDCTVKALKIQREAFRSKERELSKAEYYRLLSAAKKRNNIRLYLLMETICATGIRVSELRFITAEAVEGGSATVSLKGKTRKVLIPKTLCGQLRRYCKSRSIRSGSIFITRSGVPMDRSNILHEMKALCTAAGVRRGKVFPHNLRHLFACAFYRAVKDLSRLADLLGHASVNTTRIYICVSGEEQLRQIERLGLVI